MEKPGTFWAGLSEDVSVPDKLDHSESIKDLAVG